VLHFMSAIVAGVFTDETLTMLGKRASDESLWEIDLYGATGVNYTREIGGSMYQTSVESPQECAKVDTEGGNNSKIVFAGRRGDEVVGHPNHVDREVVVGHRSDDEVVGHLNHVDREVVVGHRSDDEVVVADRICVLVPRHRQTSLAAKQRDHAFTRCLIGIGCARILQTVSIQAVTCTYALFIHKRFTSLDPSMAVGSVMSASAGVMVLCQVLLYGRLYQRFGPFVTMHGALVSMAIGLFALYPTTCVSFWVHGVVTCLFYTSGYALSDTGMPTIMSLYASAERQGLAQGVLAWCQAVAKIFSPVLYTCLFQMDLFWNFGVAGVCALLAIVPMGYAQWHASHAP